jgi:hypothetical protein
MKQLSKEEQISLLSKLYWDMNVDPEDIYKILNTEYEKLSYEKLSIEVTNLYRRLLKTYDWYTLLKLIPKKKLLNVLHDDVINHLYPKDLKKRFIYARQFLSK